MTDSSLRSNPSAPSREEPRAGVRTKIVATIGPSSRAPEALGRLFRAGVDVVRLNCSHGTAEERTATLADVRAVAAREERVIGVLADLSGPKIRLGTLFEEPLDCHFGDEYLLTTDEASNDPQRLSCNDPRLPGALSVGDPVLFADGTVAMEVLEAGPDRARLKVTMPGVIRSRQGINVPGSSLGLESLTPKDLEDLDWVAEHPVEYVALSFVRSGADVERLQRELQRRGIRAKIVSKIEKPQAIADLEAILKLSDAVMVARGDLGVEVDVERVPALQKRIIREAHEHGVPAIIATQMLTSMEQANRPTRAEASDVFNAVLDGADAVMLSGETAIGSYPVETVSTMSRILAEAERSLSERPDPRSSERATSRAAGHRNWVSPITAAVVEAAGIAARRVDAALMIVATQSGKTALAASLGRNRTPTIALSQSEEIARRLSLLWGVTPLRATQIEDADEALDHAIAWAKSAGVVRSGDRVVLLRGFVPGQPTHNALIIREIP